LLRLRILVDLASPGKPQADSGLRTKPFRLSFEIPTISQSDLQPLEPVCTGFGCQCLGQQQFLKRFALGRPDYKTYQWPSVAECRAFWRARDIQELLSNVPNLMEVVGPGERHIIQGASILLNSHLLVTDDRIAYLSKTYQTTCCK
jgi:hypothetical protein